MKITVSLIFVALLGGIVIEDLASRNWELASNEWESNVSASQCRLTTPEIQAFWDGGSEFGIRAIVKAKYMMACGVGIGWPQQRPYNINGSFKNLGTGNQSESFRLEDIWK